ncbi:DDE family transposase [Paractinoplanes brasiliensis]|uniref:DDE family transposase n=1 Tax=Paractinoplanes brasiliensis TaxID=52695 RepID=A0A4R6JMR4_9ACTN|nr:DDE family transposase [Actinoplanes brasiliensis]
MFPYLPCQDGYNKRMRKAGPLLALVMRHLATRTPSWHDNLRLIDSTPIPCAASRETAKRSELAGDAGYGYCASHSRFFWGFRLCLVCSGDGLPVIWGLANPKLGEREVMTALLEADHDLVQTGQVLLGDKGFAGREFETFVTEQLGAHFVRPDRTPDRRLRPRRTTTTGPDHRDLAQLDHRRTRQAFPDRLRPLKTQGINHLVSCARNSLKI